MAALRFARPHGDLKALVVRSEVGVVVDETPNSVSAGLKEQHFRRF
jgi:hypothetical protein